MDNLNSIIDEAYTLFEEKQFTEALTKIEEISSELDRSASNLNLRDDDQVELKASVENFKGFNYLGCGDLDNAKAAFEKALELKPNSSQACAGLGEVFYLCSMDYEAKVLYEWALDNNPLNQLAVAGLAKINKNLGMPENHNTLNIGTSIKKKQSFFSLLGEAYKLFSEGKHSEALVKLEEAEKLFGKVVSKNSVLKISSLENFKGFNYLAMKQFDKAHECFENALNLNHDSSQACAGLGELFFLKNEDEQAKSMFEWSLKNNPENQLAAAGLARANSSLGYEQDHSTLAN